TSGQVWLHYPADWMPLYESFRSDVRVWTPDEGSIVAWLLLFVWTERMLAALAIRRSDRMILAAVVALAALAWGWMLVALLLANLFLSVLLVLPWIRSRKWNVAAW